MNRFQLIAGFLTRGAAQEYADSLPPEAKAEVVPYNLPWCRFAFAVDVSRDYVGGRL